MVRPVRSFFIRNRPHTYLTFKIDRPGRLKETRSLDKMVRPGHSVLHTRAKFFVLLLVFVPAVL